MECLFLKKEKSEYTNPDNDPKGPWSTNPWKAAVGRGGTTYSILQLQQG